MTSRAVLAPSASRRILTICSGLYFLPFIACLYFAANLTIQPVHFLGVRSSVLIKRCKDNGLFPVFMESHISSLVTTLTSGVPTARNRTASHGQGAVTVE